MTPLNLLFTLDDRYVDHLKTVLISLFNNSEKVDYQIYLLQKEALEANEALGAFCQQLGMTYHPVIIGENAFEKAPVSNRYPETIYYRLLAQKYLPENLDRILYLDVDLLCINNILPLYNMEMGNHLYAAASHVNDSSVANLVNKLRLHNFEAESYFNTGVLLINLEACRRVVDEEAILDYINQNAQTLILPDQDVLNALYGHRTILLPDQIYNFDTRYSVLYKARGRGDWDLDWVMVNTVFLHFCGKDKPWNPAYKGRYAALYKHYQHKAAVIEKDQT